MQILIPRLSKEICKGKFIVHDGKRCMHLMLVSGENTGQKLLTWWEIKSQYLDMKRREIRLGKSFQILF